MSKRHHSEIPDFLIQNLNNGQPMSRADVSEIDEILNAASGFKYPDSNVDAQWASFRSKIATPMEVITPRKKIFKLEMFRWVAAAVVVFVLGIAVSNYYSNSNGFSAVYATSDNISNIRLPDGTTVVLSQNSELVVNAINDTKRELWLKSGQAYFNVSHNNLPFTVETSKGRVSVLGTEFNISSYKNERFQVYLKKGKIEMSLKTGKVMMKPGELLSENDNQTYSITSINDNRALAWIDNKLVFENTSLSEIISVLESNFNVKFIYDEKLKDEKFNLHVEELNAEQVAELLSKLTNSKVSVQ